VQCGDRRLRLLHPAIGLEAREDRIIERDSVLRHVARTIAQHEGQRQRHECLRSRAEHGSAEPGRRDANDRQRFAIHDERAPDDACVSAELVPIAVTQHGYAALVERLLVLRPDQSPEGSLRPQRLKILARDRHG
jgi:hypothetical protein